MRDTSWMDQRNCADADPDLFTSLSRTDANKAKEYCKRCPVALSCLEWAIDMQITEGIFAGMGYAKRRAFANSRASHCQVR